MRRLNHGTRTFLYSIVAELNKLAEVILEFIQEDDRLMVKQPKKSTEKKA